MRIFAGAPNDSEVDGNNNFQGFSCLFIGEFQTSSSGVAWVISVRAWRTAILPPEKS